MSDKKIVRMTCDTPEEVILIAGGTKRNEFQYVQYDEAHIGKTVEAIGIGRYPGVTYRGLHPVPVTKYVKVIMFTDGTADSFDMTYDEAQAMDLEKLFGEIDNENEIRD